jgi:hypothetical protein
MGAIAKRYSNLELVQSFDMARRGGGGDKIASQCYSRKNGDRPKGRCLKAWCYAPRKPAFSVAPLKCAVHHKFVLLTSIGLIKLYVFYALHHAIRHDMIQQLTCWVGLECANREISKIGGAIGRVQTICKDSSDS